MTRTALVTGGAGFLGSHLCERLAAEGLDVVCVDSFTTGFPDNLAGLRDRPGLRLVEADVRDPIELDGPVDVVFHLASAASPPAYLQRPIETLETGSMGTRNALLLAQANDARFVLASTSEIYGDPEISPQPESYRGNVSCTGPRSVYDEAKRFAEALTMAFHRTHGTNTAIARIFNTYGPRLSPGDGRVISNFISQALEGRDLTVYGDGSQTRSFCYVDDLIEGLVALASSTEHDPVNLGNPNELTILEVAELILGRIETTSRIRHDPLPEDDPVQRCPDIARARTVLGWEPQVPLDDGLGRTIEWFRRETQAHLEGA